MSESILKSARDFLFQNWFFLLLALFLLGFYVFPDRSIHRNGYYILLFLPVLILFFRRRDLRSIVLTVPFLLILTFVLYTAISFFWADNFDWKDSYDVVRYFLLVLSFQLVIILAFEDGRHSVDQLLWWTMLGVSIIAVIAMLVFYQDNPFPQARVPGLSAYTSVQTTSANMYGFFAMTGLAFLIHEDKRDKLSRAILALTVACIAVIFMFMVFSQTRGALVALFFASGVLLMLNRWWKSVLIAIVIAVLTVAFVEFSDSIEGFFERGPGPRIHLWADSLRLIAERPLLGYGDTANFVLDGGVDKTGSHIFYGHPHNVILFVSLKYGLLGLALWTALTGYALYRATCIGKITRDWTLAVLLIFSLTAMMFTSRNYLDSPNAVWLLYWLPVGLIFFTNQTYQIKTGST